MNSEKTDPSSLSVWTKLWRGSRLKCPNCGRGRLLRAYLRPVEACSVCEEGYAHIRADDAPPYITLLLSGHLVVPLALMHVQLYHPPIWILFVIWIPVMLATILLMLPCAKGATVALMWHLGLQGEEYQGVEVDADTTVDQKKTSDHK